MTTTFFRLLKDTDKAAALEAAVAAYSADRPDGERTFTVDPADFSKVPNTPFAYWVDDEIRELFVKLPPFESEGRTVRVGLQTSDDFRFVRAWWEVDPARRLDPGLASAPSWRDELSRFQDWCRTRTREGKYWVPFAKGGEYSPYYSDIHLVVNWKDDGREIKSFADPKTGRTYSRPQNAEYYFRPGMTWPERTTSGFSGQPMPPGVIFSQVGILYWTGNESNTIAAILAANTRLTSYLIESLVGSGDSTVSGSAGRHYTTGLIAKLPAVQDLYDALEVGKRFHPAFQAASLLSCLDPTALRYGASSARITGRLIALDFLNVYEQWLRLVVHAYEHIEVAETILIQHADLGPRQKMSITVEEGERNLVADALDATVDESLIDAIRWCNTMSVDELVDHVTANAGRHRWSSKKSYALSRRHELVSALLGKPASLVVAADQREGVLPPDARWELLQGAMDFFVGATLCRWDTRLRTVNKASSTVMDDPFHSLPVVPPATLVGPDGLPASSGNIVSEEWLRARPDAISLPPPGSVDNPTIPDAEYPISVPWDGILVDVETSDADIVTRIRRVLEVLHGSEAEKVEHELCEELGVETLRDYMASPKGFFADHLKRYSKSRRKAPIYWPLSTASGGYTVWVYYPRLTSGTLFTILDRYLHPHRDVVEKQYEELSGVPAAQRTKAQQKAFDRAARDREELAALEEEIRRVADLPYRPDHDDGVPICAAPLYRLFRHKQWSDYLKGIWKDLEAGKYDWAHLAYGIWPDRVREKARKDRSISIAHDLEEQL